MNTNGIIVDLFAGGGGASLGIERALGRSPDIAINHDPDAVAMHAANHPQTAHYCKSVYDVSPIDAVGGRAVDLLWASPDCFPAGTLILTPDGLRPIETVGVGDLVLSHRGRWQPVISTMAKEAETVEVRGHGHYGLITTPNHPFYSKRITKRYPGRRNEEGKRPGTIKTLVENPYWPAAENMAGKLWATPKTFPASSIPTCSGAEFSEDFFYLLGRWIGDGSLNKGDVEICCGLAECDEFSDRLASHPMKTADGKQLNYRMVDHGSSKLFVWGNAALVEWLRANVGDSSSSKHLPMWCLSIQANWRKALLAGYVDADGYCGVRTETTSVSKQLAIGIRLLAVSLGHAAALYRQAGKPGQIEGRSFIGKDTYRLAWREDLQRETVLWDRTHLFSPVREVTPTGVRHVVFSLEVADDASYVADGIVVHNCRHFSRAKGAVPVSPQVRDLAWVAYEWALWAKPRIILLENVLEFRTWGPLIPLRDGDGNPMIDAKTGEPKLVPDPARKGETFREFVAQLQSRGYRVEWRVLNAADFGAPTARRRLFMICRRDGLPILWPEPTHGPGRPKPWRTAAECIDWNDLGTSIFDRKKALRPKTLARIARGIRKYVLGTASPFIVQVQHTGDGFRGQSLDQPLTTISSKHGYALVSPTLVQTGYGERKGQAPRALDLHEPLGTAVAGGQKHALAVAHLLKFYGGVTGQTATAPLGTVTAWDHHGLAVAHLSKFYGEGTGSSLDSPMPTCTAGPRHFGLVAALLTKYYGSGVGQPMDEPLATVTGHDRFGLVTLRLEGETYAIADITFRMLKPRELARAQGFEDSYNLLDRPASINPKRRRRPTDPLWLTQAEQVARIGNSVCPPVAEAVVRAQFAAELAAVGGAA